MTTASSASAATRRNDRIRTSWPPRRGRIRTSLPPRAGQIRVRIFASMVKKASSAALKAWEFLGIHKHRVASSASQGSPPPST